MRATFSIDDETEAALRRTAERLGQSKSAIVRRAVVEFEARCDRLTEGERQEKLSLLAKVRAMPKTRTAAEVERELDAVREDRRRGRLVR